MKNFRKIKSIMHLAALFDFHALTTKDEW